MSIIALDKKNFDVVTLQMHPKRKFSSSSSGITGSIFVYAQRSPSIKDQSVPAFTSSAGTSGFDADNIDQYRRNIFDAGKATYDYTAVYPSPPAADGHSALATWQAVSRSFDSAYRAGSIYDGFEGYLTGVNQVVQSPSLKKYVEVLRFVPTVKFTADTLRKSVVVNNLFDYYRTLYPQAHFSYTNYNTFNFFTASSVSPNRALIYPSPSLTANPAAGTYAITGAFNVSFYINPRYTTEGPGFEYKAGTILHMSSCYAISLHTGSGVSRKGIPNTFRLALQISSSADTPPSEIDLNIKNNSRSYPQDLIFVSDEHSLKLNHWHHVSINYENVQQFSTNGGTGSFWIDGVQQTKSRFLIASNSFNTPFFTQFNPLFVGNYYDGQNSGATSDLRAYFNSKAASVEGVQNWGPGFSADPTATLLNHPLNAEFHDLRIYTRQITDNEIMTASVKGPSREQMHQSMKMYLPPFFTKDSPQRNVLRTPFQSRNEKTEKPFNTWLSYDVNGKDINLENFVRDHRHKTFPRLFHLTSSEISDTTKDWQTANRLLYEFGVQSSYVRARNLTVIPNDNGLFLPAFDLLMTQSDPTGVRSIYGKKPASGSFVSQFVNDLGLSDLSLITLRNMHKMPLLVTGVMQSEGAEDKFGVSGYVVQLTESGDWSSRYEPQILQLTRDNTSDEIVFFDASNLFYGQSIKPGTFSLLDKAITGSDGRVSIRLVDDLRGNLYRADSSTPPATWNSVGNILYEEGISVIKSPNIPFFGRDQFEIEFKGHQNIHAQEININANVGRINSSSNPTFHKMKADNYSNTTDDVFVAISEVLLHDDNLNVVGRAKLAQPVVKKLTDKYLFRLKMDY